MTLKLLKYILFGMGIVFSCFSCELFDYHPLYHKAYSFGDKDLNIQNSFRVDTYQDKDTICFVFVSDTHGDYSKTKQFVSHINKRHDVDFVIHGGDFTDFGLPIEFEKFYSIFSRLEYPYFVLIGNHDMLGKGCNLYQELFGPDNYYFRIRNLSHYKNWELNIIMMNTNMLQSGWRGDPIEYIRGFNTDINTIFVMHSPPGSEQFYDKAQIEEFKTILDHYSSKVLFGIHGHQHIYSTNIYLDNGVMFYGCDNIAKRTYLLFKVTNDGYTYERIEF